MNKPAPKPIHEHSLDAFDEGLTSGSFDRRVALALHLVEEYPMRTASELLRIGFDFGYYDKEDPNYIRPRLDALIRRYGQVVRPGRRKCEITGKTAFIHVLNPNAASFRAQQDGNGPTIKYHMEEKSKSDPERNHTTIYYHDGRITCSCRGFRFANRCHHVIGLRLAIDGFIAAADHDYIKKKVGGGE